MESFGEQRMFLNIPNYQWHIQGASVDQEARPQILALVDWLYKFGHFYEDRDMELCGRMQNTVDALGCGSD